MLRKKRLSSYRGPDRRTRSEGFRRPVRSDRVVWITALVAAGAVLPGLFLLGHRLSVQGAVEYGAVAAGILFVAAGGGHLVAWRIAGRAVLAWSGSGLAIFGVMVLVSDGLTRAGGASSPDVRPIDGFIATLLAGWLLWRGLTDREVNAGVSPLLNVCSSIAIGMLAMGLLNAVATQSLLPAWMTGPSASGAFDATAGAAWVFLAVVTGRVAVRGDGTATSWGVVIAALIAVGFGTQAVSGRVLVSTVSAAAVMFVAASLALATTFERLQSILTSESRAQRHLQLALAESLRQAAADRKEFEDWLHDVRNAVIGIQAADAVMRTDWQSPNAQPDLADALTAELSRLHTLLDPMSLRPADVDLAQLLEPIVAAERALGARIAIHLDVPVVKADPGALSRVFQNVLTNARLYAPGTEVTITSRRGLRGAEIEVCDGGSGIDPAEREAVFERGRRGSAAAGIRGSGLGLHVARKLMRAMGGDIAVGGGEDRGCCISLVLPMPARAVVPAQSDRGHVEASA